MHQLVPENIEQTLRKLWETQVLFRGIHKRSFKIDNRGEGYQP